ncbi:class F sortase [Streptomyces sp. NPDC000594]|uniref:class F sortase n=1 Tax=Streptomyces sp. NPDC000594 TaxID=3154261 RepID=UPI003325005C
MQLSRRRSRRVRPALAAPLLLAFVLVTGAGCATGPENAATVDHGPATSATAPPAADRAAASASGGDGAKGKREQREAEERKSARPTRVTVPSLGIDSSLMPLGLNRDGTVQVPPPERGMTAGWYTGGPVPGERGPAVIIGHNSTVHGKAVFHDLKKIAKGAEITVRNTAGTTTTFTVTHREAVSKKAFPTQRVYGPTNGRELRLITCDGAFDPEGHPVDNLIVYATRT